MWRLCLYKPQRPHSVHIILSTSLCCFLTLIIIIIIIIIIFIPGIIIIIIMGVFSNYRGSNVVHIFYIVWEKMCYLN